MMAVQRPGGRLHAFHKMVSIVRGANIVRRELGLPAAESAPPIRAWRCCRRPHSGLRRRAARLAPDRSDMRNLAA
jgi:hypothetical protein